MDIGLLRQVPLFASLPESELERLAASLRITSCPRGSVLIREGDAGDCFYVILSGQVEIIQALDSEDERLLGVRDAGEFVGEMSLINPDGRRTASVRAFSDLQARELSRDEFTRLLEQNPTLSYEMLRVMSLRLRDSHDLSLRDLREKNLQLTAAYEELKAAQAQLIEKERLEHELEIARQMQASLIPREAPEVAGWDFAAWWQPAREVGGDFYDFISIPGERRAAPEHGVVVADVSDKGIAAALFMALSRSIIRASMTAARTPARGIMQANGLISADATNGMFVTLFYGQLSWDKGELVYVNAGHNPPLLYRAGKDEVVELKRTGLALGLDETQQYAERTTLLESRDVLLLYTDGAIDAMNERGEEFGLARLQELLTANHTGSTQEIMAALQQALQQHSASAPLFDDITVVLVKRN
ncbi:MAG: PP2C family protein-serine/threonine phosphatase [Rudaea sp.]